MDNQIATNSAANHGPKVDLEAFARLANVAINIQRQRPCRDICGWISVVTRKIDNVATDIERDIGGCVDVANDKRLLHCQFQITTNHRALNDQIATQLLDISILARLQQQHAVAAGIDREGTAVLTD